MAERPWFRGEECEEVSKHMTEVQRQRRKERLVEAGHWIARILVAFLTTLLIQGWKDS